MEIALSKILIPVRDTTEHLAGVDEVEAVLVKCPLHGHVVHLKLAIRRHPCRLYRAKIGANNLGVGKLVRYFDCPYPCASPDVEDALWVCDWRKIMLVPKSEQPCLMGNVLLVVVSFVIGAPICAVAIGMIAATVFPAIARVAGVEGVGNASVQGSCISSIGRIGVD